MLIKFKSDYEKISMGLLSYTPDLKDMPRLKQEMDKYKEDDDRLLYLWKSKESDDLCGLLGIEVQDQLILLRHIAITPSYRNEGLAVDMLNDLAKLFEGKNIVGTIETASIITAWHKQQDSVDEAGDQEISKEEWKNNGGNL